MFTDSSWLYELVSLAGASLIAAMYLTGLVISLLRWNDGVAPRLAAIGFGLMLIASATGHVLFRFFMDDSMNAPVFARLAVFSSITTLMSATAWGLLLVALRKAFLDAARWRSEISADR